MTAQPALPGVAALPPVGDPLGRRYTPDLLALRICQRLAAAGVSPSVVIEGHVGGGAFVRAARATWPSARIIGVDIDPTAPGLALCDAAHTGSWEDVAAALLAAHPHALVVGNPPFDAPRSGDPDRAQRHLRAAAAPRVPVRIAWVLPLAYLGTQAWHELLTEHPTCEPEWPIVGRPWGEHVRETAVYHWCLPAAPQPSRAIGDWRSA